MCLGLPGALPVLNRAAVDDAIRAALALGCTIHERSIFARKNYFYPDLPKGYQISQYEQPLATDGRDGRRRHHRASTLEEDAGKSLHEGFRRLRSQDVCRLQPQRRAADRDRDASRICGRRRLRPSSSAACATVLVWLGVNDGNMEEGSLRCDANVSVRPAGTQTLGTKAEVKNLNSFRFLQKALEHEIARQIDA